MAKIATVRVFWTPSVSGDVVEQGLTISNVTGGQVVFQDAVPPLVAEHVFDVAEEQSIHVDLVARDEAGNESPHVTLDFTTPDLTAPLAPTGLNWEVTNVRDV